ncbi:hypothetical protein ASD64_01330 [Mesorhizobium sp. Root157]|uniref:hypothetical protein n=1 Tax=Mesorhizobium sp. Root157 TaxID=1736477 RepID=UPI0006F88597|nr:hypothetical protein [Mesorhizobium sp. Root157]KRA00245.1 hypothetical protein ASD64_01330 [Mesorhizobium sp. Root157]
MAATLVQSAKGTSNLATTTATFATTPTSGNTVILSIAADDYNGTPNTGWTESTGMAREGGSFHGGYKWWRISNGTNSFQYTIGSATKSTWILEEWSGLEASPYDISAGQNVNSAANSYSTPNLTPSAGERLLHATVGASLSGSAMADPGHTWDSSFTGIDKIGSPAAPADAVGTAYRIVTANGSTAYSTTATFATLAYSVESRSGMIIAFKVAGGGGGSQTLTGTLFTNTNTFYGGTVQRGAVTLSGSLFTNTNSFYGGAVVPGAVTLTGSLFTDPDGFYGGTVAQSGAPQTLVGSLFTNSQTFYGGNVQTSITLDGSLFTDGDTFYGGTVTTAYVITGSLYTDPDTFFGGTVVQPEAPQVLVGELYDNDNQFFGGVVVGGRTTQVTSSGGVGTTWAHKTLSQIEREKKAALKRAKKRVVEIIADDAPKLGELLAIVRQEVRQEAVSFPANVMNDIISRLHKEMRAALIRRIEEEDEADAEFLLLVA